MYKGAARESEEWMSGLLVSSDEASQIVYAVKICFAVCL
jgi:hypothetical protein